MTSLYATPMLSRADIGGFNNFIINCNLEDLKDDETERRDRDKSLIIDLSLKSSSMTSPVIQEVTSKETIVALFKTAAIYMGISTLDLKLTPLITRIAIDKLGLCVDHLVSNSAKSLISYIINPLATLNERLGNLFGNNPTGSILVPAALEELEFRWLIQDVVLKKIPEQILKWVAPQYAHVVDSNAARITRIALTAFLFSICHLNQLDCSGMGGIAPLIGGLVYGYVYEYTSLSLPGCINLHGIYNILNHSGLI